MYGMNDPLLPLIFIALGFSLWAQWKVKSTFNKFAKISVTSGKTAAEVARSILNVHGLQSIPVNRTPGQLSDHYDPLKKTLNLSESVFDSSSVAAIGVAAHEAGHAIQHAHSYVPLALRNNFFPAANIGSHMAVPLFFLGILFSFPLFMDLGIVFFAFAVAFSIITLPVEFDASHRALAVLADGKYLTVTELPGARSVLDAAAMTYVAATAMAVLQLIRLLVLRNSRDD